jgi:hypothetical protein
MTPKENLPEEDNKNTQLLEEICEHTMAIRRVTNRILDHLHECQEKDDDYDPETVSWEDMYDNDDMYY